MKIFTIILIIIAMVSISCEETQAPEQEINRPEVTGNDTLKISSPPNLKPKIPLTREAKEGVKSWTFYNDLASAIDSLNSKSLGDLKLKLEQFDNLYLAQSEAQEAQVKTTSFAISNNAIKARLKAVETKLHALKNQSQLNDPNPEKLSILIGDVINAHQNLKLQLNELFDTSFKDLLEEIKLENENAAKQDSISKIQN